MQQTTQNRSRPLPVGRLAAAVGVALLFLLAPPTAAAGSPDDPEIRDPQGDTHPVISPTPGAADALDVAAVWFTETNETFTVSWQMAKVTASGANDRFEYTLMFSANGTRVSLHAWRQLSDTMMDAGLWAGDGFYPCAHTSPSRPASQAQIQFDDPASRIEITVPRWCEGEDSSLEMPKGVRIAEAHAITSHCTVLTNGCETTRVDDTTEGRVFAFTTVLGSSAAGGDGALDPEPVVEASAKGLLLPAILVGLVAAAAWTRSPRRAIRRGASVPGMQQ